MSTYHNYFSQNKLSINEVIDLYESNRSIFPKPSRMGKLKFANSISEISEKFDAFIFDSYGVLNTGSLLIKNVKDALIELKEKGKIIIVLTNGASYPTSNKVSLFNSWCLPFENEEVISSRDLLKDYLKNQDQIKWGVIGSPRSDLNELGVNGHILGESISKLNECEGIIYLGCEYWDQNKQIKLEHKLQNTSMKILVGNPDIVAPQKSSFSIEPGFWSLNFHKSKYFDIKYFGKPHLDIFEKAIQNIFKISQRKFNLDRIAMIGDSLHTDVLGGLASGISTVLVTNHGLFKNHDYQKEILRTQIYPDWIIPSI